MVNSTAGESEADREDVQSSAIMSWAPVDIEAAAEWLDRIVPYDDSILALAEQYAPVDLENAVAWAKRASGDRSDDIVAKALLKAVKHHLVEDLVPILGAGNLSPEAMAKIVRISPPGRISAFD